MASMVWLIPLPWMNSFKNMLCFLRTSLLSVLINMCVHKCKHEHHITKHSIYRNVAQPSTFKTNNDVASSHFKCIRNVFGVCIRYSKLHIVRYYLEERFPSVCNVLAPVVLNVWTNCVQKMRKCDL